MLTCLAAYVSAPKGSSCLSFFLIQTQFRGLPPGFGSYADSRQFHNKEFTRKHQNMFLGTI